MQAVDFDDYLKWFNSHDVVIKGQTADGTNKATASAPLGKIHIPAAVVEDKVETELHHVEDYFCETQNPTAADHTTQVDESDVGYEFIVEYSVNGQGIVIATCNGYTVQPAVALNWEKEMEEDEDEFGAG